MNWKIVWNKYRSSRYNNLKLKNKKKLILLKRDYLMLNDFKENRTLYRKYLKKLIIIKNYKLELKYYILFV